MFQLDMAHIPIVQIVVACILHHMLYILVNQVMLHVYLEHKLHTLQVLGFVHNHLEHMQDMMILLVRIDMNRQGS